jgi:2'-5' RNA ligase
VAAHGVGAFPDVRRPRTLWIGMQEGSEEMVALHDAIGKGLGQFGFREEARRYRPHLTIGRVRGEVGIDGLAARLAEHADLDCGLTTVGQVVVLSSELTRQGPIYEQLGHGDLLG